jgi:multidrug efflux pump subunit AcrA (membrane-fusion protein)
MVARVRRLMLISALTTAIAIAAVLGAIGYRIFRAGESSAGPPATGIVTLPKGARVISTAVAEGRIVVTFDIGGASELRVYDIKTLKEIGRLGFATEP